MVVGVALVGKSGNPRHCTQSIKRHGTDYTKTSAFKGYSYVFGAKSESKWRALIGFLKHTATAWFGASAVVLNLK